MTVSGDVGRLPCRRVVALVSHVKSLEPFLTFLGVLQGLLLWNRLFDHCPLIHQLATEIRSSNHKTLTPLL